MNILRAILIGVLSGILFFVAFKFVLILLLIGGIFMLAGGGRRKRMYWKEQRLAYVENIRNMNDDEYQQFRSNYGRGHHCYHR